MGNVYITITAVYTDGNYVFWSPDGVGHIWYDTVEDAIEDSGYDTVIYIDPEDMMEEMN